MTTKKPPLVPPDPNQCQAHRKVGCWPDAKHFMNFGPAQLVRCENKPIVIVKEKEPSKEDGRRGSMSMCAGCLTKFYETGGRNRVVIKDIAAHSAKPIKKGKK